MIVAHCSKRVAFNSISNAEFENFLNNLHNLRKSFEFYL
ncbi:hypothetical protein LEP1GSC062_4344 [Leptospira alexanderi serovar Manhao 3 str. L 60]|uniref:Uncharacterized protein n=1 Tax=Leptospira alexanderi serovar Manhao 3 str. L 60 TaxID=1049759 RepID=V6I9E7_9LEPT|nr:hypothetical protein LEP1GSC062_4344 [Leptospira alexanderi serovar Manhao 3 str. L 60]